MFEKFKFYLIILTTLILLFFFLPLKDVINFFKYEFISKKDLIISFTLVNPEIKYLSADPDNFLALKVEVRNTSGHPIPGVHVNLGAEKSLGYVYPSDIRTDKFGQAIVNYIPPSNTEINTNGKLYNVRIKANIINSDINDFVNIALKQVPIVYVHGYKANASIFDNLKEFLQAEGFESSGFDYKSENGIIQSSYELGNFLKTQKHLYFKQGFQVKRFDLIAHSMGGLVTRYYSCSKDYIRSNDIRKIIFLSVPHKGSPWASLGLDYYNDQGVRDLVPDNRLISKELPKLINKGLNNAIEVGNIMAQYDEVVSPESASLEEWGIKTEVFNIGDSSFTVDNLLNGSIIEAANHKNILNNKKVFQRIFIMLSADLPFPSTKIK